MSILDGRLFYLNAYLMRKKLSLVFDPYFSTLTASTYLNDAGVCALGKDYITSGVSRIIEEYEIKNQIGSQPSFSGGFNSWNLTSRTVVNENKF